VVERQQRTLLVRCGIILLKALDTVGGYSSTG